MTQKNKPRIANVQEFQQVQVKRLDALNQAIEQLEKKLAHHPAKDQQIKQQSQRLIECYASETKNLLQQLQPACA